MGQEYLIPIGADLGPLIEDLRTVRGETTKLNESLEKSGATVKTVFTEASKAQDAYVKGTIDANKAAATQASELKQVGAAMGALSDDTKEVVVSQDQLNKALSSTIEGAKKQLAGLKEGSKEYGKLAKEIQAAEAGLKALNKTGDEGAQKMEKLKKTYRDNVNVLQSLAQQGLQNTKVYKDLEKVTGELDDTIRDVNEAIKLAGSDTKGFDNLIGSAQAVTGAFSIAQGAVALFGESNEAIEKTLLKVNSAMSILNGLQAIQSELKRKDSLVSKAAGIAQAAYATVVGTSTGALKVFRVALASTGVGALVLALGYVITNFDELKEKVLNMFPGLRTLSTFIGNLVESFTDFVGITSEANRELEKFNDNATTKNKDLERSIKILEAQGNKEKEIYRLRHSQLLNEISMLNKREDTLKHLTKEELEQREDLRADLEALREGEQKRIRDEEKKSADEREKDRQDRIKKAQEAADKLTAIEKDMLDKQRAYDKQYRDLKVAAIQDETLRLIEAENAQFEDLKLQAQNQVDQFKGTASQRVVLQDAANRVIEQLYQNHYINLVKIAKEGYAKDQLEKEKALEDQDKFLEEQFAKDVAATTKKVKKTEEAVAKSLDIFKRANEGLTKIFKDAGFSDEQSAEIIATAKKTFDGILSAYTDSIDQQIEAKQRQVEALTTQIDEVEQELNREVELQKDGYANNVAAKQSEIATLKAEREKQLEDEKRLQKERAKIASLEIAISTAQQTTTLALAAAELFKNAAKSSLNPILGVILGIAAAGSMFAGFLAIKGKMKAAQDAVPKFRKGDVFDVLKGQASHESGGVSIVNNRGDRLAELEGDEKLFVVNKGSSGKHEDLLRAINNDDFSHLPSQNGSLKQLLKEINGVHLIEDAPGLVIPKQRKYQDAKSSQLAALSNLASLGKLDELVVELKGFRKEEKSKPVVIPLGKTTQVIYPGYVKNVLHE